MKNKIVKNFKINKRLAFVIGSIVLIYGSIVFVGKKNNKIYPIEASMEQVLEENKDNTCMDEILSLNEIIDDKIWEVSSTMEINSPSDKDNSLSEDLMDYINKLELYIEFINKFNQIDFDNRKELKDIDENSKNKLYEIKDNVDEVHKMLEIINNKDITDIEKARYMQLINYLENYYKREIICNAPPVIEDFLKKLLKSYACSCSGLEFQYYDNCTISSNNKILRDNIVVVDPISGAKYTYFIDRNSKEMKTVLNNLYKLQNFNIDTSYTTEDYDTIYKICVKSLNDAKELIETGVELNNNKFISINYDKNNDVKTKIKTKY